MKRLQKPLWFKKRWEEEEEEEVEEEEEEPESGKEEKRKKDESGKRIRIDSKNQVVHSFGHGSFAQC